MRNNANTHILGALKAGLHEIPYAITGLDFDNGTEFLNKAVIKWAGEMEIFFTRSRPYKKNDQATIESKNNHLVRKYGFYYRYDTDEERAVLNRLWRLVNDRLNYLTPTIKPIGYGSGRDGQRRRLYDAPKTPLDRLLEAGVLSPAQESELRAHRDSLNPAAIARQIADLQTALLRLAKDKTEQLYLATIPTALPDVRSGIRTNNKAASSSPISRGSYVRHGPGFTGISICGTRSRLAGGEVSCPSCPDGVLVRGGFARARRVVGSFEVVRPRRSRSVRVRRRMVASTVEELAAAGTDHRTARVGTQSAAHR